jgi:hypothetical protein
MALAIPAPPGLALLIVLPFLPAPGVAFAQTLEAPQEIAIEMDGDGKPDRAVLLAGPSGDGALDLHVHLGSNSGSEPDIVKKAILNERILAFESREPGMLSITTCHGCGARKSFEETLTISYRNGTLLVGGYSRNWEWYTPFADGTDELLMGGCRIDFLSGRGWVSKGLEEEKPVAERFKPIALADWSFEKAPSICKFGNEHE